MHGYRTDVSDERAWLQLHHTVLAPWLHLTHSVHTFKSFSWSLKPNSAATADRDGAMRFCSAKSQKLVQHIRAVVGSAGLLAASKERIVSGTMGQFGAVWRYTNCSKRPPSSHCTYLN